MHGLATIWGENPQFETDSARPPAQLASVVWLEHPHFRAYIFNSNYAARNIHYDFQDIEYINEGKTLASV